MFFEEKEKEASIVTVDGKVIETISIPEIILESERAGDGIGRDKAEEIAVQRFVKLYDEGKFQ